MYGHACMTAYRLTMPQSGDANVGSAQGSSNSASSLLSTLAPVALYALVWLFLFLIFRTRFKRNYQPRTFLGSLRPEQRSPTMPQGFLNWFGAFYHIPDMYVLNHHSLDGFLFLRFLKISVVSCFVGCLITWPVLFPINITGGAGHTQLDILTFANVQNKWKYYAHAGCAIIFFTFIIFMITRESIYYVNLRQAYLLSPLYASRISSRTVLFQSVPLDYMDEGRLRRMLGPSVVRIWFATDCKELEDKVEERDKAAMKLEGAETKLIVTANGARVKEEKKGGRSASQEGAIEESAGNIAARYLKPKQRPTHKLKFLIGKKVDTIDWCRAELNKLIPEVDSMQAAHKSGEAKLLNSVFVEFETLSEAQAAYQSLAHHQALHMAPRHVGMTPDDVIWSNLSIKWWERVIRQIVTTASVIALIIFWSIPVAAVGAISNINYLIATPAFSWLSFLNSLPPAILGVVTGLLPVVALAVLMALLPIILRLMAKLGGDPTHSAVELTVQNSYFGFQIVQVFLVATLGSAASSVGGKIAANPASAVSVLAENLPLASNFFLSWFVLQGLGVVSGILLSLVGLIVFMLLGKLLDKTPRKMYKRWISLSGLGWGTLMPVYTNLFVIAICYAAIAPLVLGFAVVGLSLFYIAYRYNLLFVSNATIDTKGRIYPRALQQVFVGLYVAELCLIGLFGIGVGDSIGALGPMILMIAMLIFTALYQLCLNAALEPLINYLPKSLDAEERSLLEMEHGEYDEKNAAHANNLAAPSKNKKKANMFTKFLRPDVHTDYASQRELVPKSIEIAYTNEDKEDAYYNPAIVSETPLLWIPRDPVGMSAQECRETSKVIHMTDEGAYLDDKNKVVWDAQDGRPPVYEEIPYY